VSQYRTLDATGKLRWIYGYVLLTVTASLTNTALLGVGALAERAMEQDGQLIKMMARLDVPITAQSIAVTAWKRSFGGAQASTAATVTLNAANQMLTWTTDASAITYAAGDSLAVKITTPLGFLPITGNLEVMLGVLDL
jgi:hypothetical protein